MMLSQTTWQDASGVIKKNKKNISILASFCWRNPPVAVFFSELQKFGERPNFSLRAPRDSEALWPFFLRHGGAIAWRFSPVVPKVGPKVTSEMSRGLYGGILKCWYPTTMVFPTRNDHFDVFWGYHHLRKHPYNSTYFRGEITSVTYL